MKTDGFSFSSSGFSRNAVALKSVVQSRIISPKKTKQIPDRLMAYKNAEALVNDITDPHGNYFAIIDGSFIFGDFIEALFVSKDIHAKQLTISTLSMNENNVDSLRNLIEGGYVDELNLVVSDYFYSHERSLLIPYIYRELDIDNKFQLAVAGSHMKVAFFETHNGNTISIHGSANLRSSNCIEQICISTDADTYEFLHETHKRIFAAFSTINKAVRNEKLWQVVAPKVDLGTEKNQALAKSQKPKNANRSVLATG